MRFFVFRQRLTFWGQPVDNVGIHKKLPIQWGMDRDAKSERPFYWNGTKY